MSSPVDPPSNQDPAGNHADTHGMPFDAETGLMRVKDGSPVPHTTHGTAADAIDVQSNAFNFLSCVQTGVDPRTGLYNVGLHLPDIQANGLMGPSLPLAFNFNPMQTNDAGFGIGWSLSTSSYNRKTQQLQLSTGERYHAIDTGAALVIPDRKLKNVLVEKAPDGSGDLLIYFLSGLTERLSNASGRDDHYLPITRCQEDGRALHFRYAPYRGQRVLTEITDDDRLLVTLIRSDTETRITLAPDTDQPAAFRLMLTNGRVSHLLLPGDVGGWHFTYRTFPSVPSLAFIESMRSPSGLRETIRYQERGHALPPRAPFTHLPRVIEQIQFPGAGQPPQRRLFEYANNNFLGFNAPGMRWEDGRDNLFSVLSDYRYSSVERWVRGEGNQATVLKSIVRVYNRYHLQCEETLTQGDAVQRQITTYHDQAGRPFSEQVACYQLPRTVTSEQYRLSAPDRVQRSSTTTRFDDFGNILEQIDPSGVKQTMRYYGAAGEDGCPADPLGFVRHLAERRIIPAAPSSYGTVHAADGTEDAKAPVRVHRYRYTALRAVDASHYFNEVRSAIVCTESTYAEVDASTPDIAPAHYARKQCWTYFDLPSDRFLHARLQTASVDITGHCTETRHDYCVDVDGTLRTEETIAGYDGTTRRASRRHALHSGLLIQEAHENGQTVHFTYDTLGRLTAETTAQGTAAEARKVYQRTLSDLQGNADAGATAREAVASPRSVTPPSAMSCAVTDAAGVTTCSWFDGFERLRAITLTLPGNPLPWTSYEATYDVLGRCIDETRYDAPMPDSGNAPITPSTHDVRRILQHRYDDWGERCATVRADGVTLHDQLDPVTRTRTQWREASSTGAALESATRVTRYGDFDAPLCIEIIPCTGSVSAGIARETRFSYDGLGRCIAEMQCDGISSPLEPNRTAKHTNPLHPRAVSSRTTSWCWDAFDREVRRTLADGTLIETDHAPHSDQPLPVSLRLTPPKRSGAAAAPIQIATQRFDGLNRLVNQSMGRRDRTYCYADAAPYPESEHTAAGRVLTSRYDPLLSFARTSRDTPEHVQHFTYETARGTLSSASSAPKPLRAAASPGSGGDADFPMPASTLTFAYDALGRCIQESRTIDNGHPDGSVTQRFSIQGQCLSRTAWVSTVATRTADTASGEESATQDYRYDTEGRLSRIDAPRLKTTLGYDRFGRLAIVEASATGADGFECLQTVCDFDALDRETGRTITLTDATTGPPSDTAIPEAHTDQRPRQHTRSESDSTRQWHLAQRYDGFDRMSHRTLYAGQDILRAETFRYDSRDRLIRYAVEGRHGPRNTDGRPVRSQSFTYDAMDNLLTCTTDHYDGNARHIAYQYTDPGDPTRLTRIDETDVPQADGTRMKAQVRSTTPVYDADGNMTGLDARTMHFDALGRMTRLTLPNASATYTYDALDRLIITRAPDQALAHPADQGRLHYLSDHVIAETVDGKMQMRLDSDGHPSALHGADDTNDSPALLVTDAQGTVILASTRRDTKQDTGHMPDAFLPYGVSGIVRSGSAGANTAYLAWQGMRRDPFSGLYPVGNGKRWYDPVLMRFVSPDPLCPFDGGGIHPYLFGLGDPINRVDPSGLLSWQSILGIAIGAIGVALTIASLGAGVAISAGLVQAGAALTAFATVPSLSVSGVVAMSAAAASLAEGATSIAAAAIQDSDAGTASTLGWVAFGLGAAASLHGLQGAVSSLSRATQGGEQLARGVRRAIAAQAAIDTVSRVQQGVSMGASNLSDSARAALDGAGWLLGAAGWMTGIAQAGAAHRQGSFTLPRQAHQAPTAGGLRSTGSPLAQTGARTAIQQRQLGLDAGIGSGATAASSQGQAGTSGTASGAGTTSAAWDRLMRTSATIRGPEALSPSQ